MSDGKSLREVHDEEQAEAFDEALRERAIQELNAEMTRLFMLEMKRLDDEHNQNIRRINRDTRLLYISIALLVLAMAAAPILGYYFR